MKDFTFAERYKLEFRGDYFNLLNHPQFDNSSFNGNTSGSNGVTTITNTATTRFSSARELQLAVRFTF